MLKSSYFRPIGLVHSHFVAKNIVVKSERMSLSSVVKQMNQTRKYTTNTFNRGSSGHHEQEENKQHTKKTEFEELDDVLPEPPKREVILAKIAGASAMFWILYKMKQDGLIVF